MNEVFYEVGILGEIHAFNTLEDAIDFADRANASLISEVGGTFADYEKCTFCGEWCESVELNKDGECTYCEQAIKSRGF